MDVRILLLLKEKRFHNFFVERPELTASERARKVLHNDSYFDHPCLVFWAVFVDSAGLGDLSKPQMVSASVEL